jgi:pimeloyl-ACP methyl ester carboxylesterase
VILACAVLTAALSSGPAVSAQSAPPSAPASGTSAPPDTGPALRTKPCVMGKRRMAALCGTLRVYEDRAAHSGRTIPIAFVALEATHPTHSAIFFNPGGPGAPATPLAPFAADGVFEPYMARLRDRYDVVFVDNRGMGGSHPLDCPALWNPANRAAYFLQLWPAAQLRACRARLAASANLDDYTTDLAVDDIDDVRAALGYPRIVLSGGSGGTQLYLDYARRHPQHVESLLLQGVAPPHFLIIPLEDARGAQVAMDRVVAACRAERACGTRFPHLGAHFAALVHRFDRGPMPVTFENAKTHRRQLLTLSKEVFADRLRQMLYGTDTARFVPYAIERAYAGDTMPLARIVDVVTRVIGTDVLPGANLSVTCAEDIPFITAADVARTSDRTFMGDARIRAQQRACAIWQVHPVPAHFQDPVRSSAPAFLISGADDPATPPEYAREELPYLSNATWLLVANASHDTELPCTMALAEQFIRARSPARLRTASCASQNRRPPFAMTPLTFEP